MESGQRIVIARRSRTALAHACHVMDAGCAWLRRLAVARKSSRLPSARVAGFIGPSRAHVAAVFDHPCLAQRYGAQGRSTSCEVIFQKMQIVVQKRTVNSFFSFATFLKQESDGQPNVKERGIQLK
jgi:hypothetical protein